MYLGEYFTSVEVLHTVFLLSWCLFPEVEQKRIISHKTSASQINHDQSFKWPSPPNNTAHYKMAKIFIEAGTSTPTHGTIHKLELGPFTVRQGGLDSSSGRGEEDSLSPQPPNVLAHAAAVTPEQCHYNPSTTSVPVRKQPTARNMFKNKIAWKQRSKRNTRKETCEKQKTKVSISIWYSVFFVAHSVNFQAVRRRHSTELKALDF